MQARQNICMSRTVTRGFHQVIMCNGMARASGVHHQVHRPAAGPRTNPSSQDARMVCLPDQALFVNPTHLEGPLGTWCKPSRFQASGPSPWVNQPVLHAQTFLQFGRVHVPRRWRVGPVSFSFFLSSKAVMDLSFQVCWSIDMSTSVYV